MYLRDCPPFLTFAPLGAVAFVPGVLWSWRILGATGTRRINAGNFSGTGRGRNPANEPTRAPWSRWPQNLNVSVPTSNRTGANDSPCFALRSSRSMVPPGGPLGGGREMDSPGPGPQVGPGTKAKFQKKVWGNY